MSSSTKRTPLEKELIESNQKLWQEINNITNNHLSYVNNSIIQNINSLKTIQKSVEETRDGIKDLERDIRSSKNLVFKLDQSIIPTVKVTEDELLETRYVVSEIKKS
ncbi:8256_t:CDS:2 [Entrophospora sp. SA101]|nr:3890_t:CDS:2 [Entrophospora sp. SA101]CAJ0755449.1 8256_t:CDS:2 [Entrophospora sp. SA101]CAJ0858993.1 13224_t:CDS:2 [Entrophospora sp. SA101]CAJ0870894.1 2465_t:CDS:2 [Entrophospora sp. SA101]CAJ0905361.1 13354_t:CDS:2 [Entrophospora sp. SA101]